MRREKKNWQSSNLEVFFNLHISISKMASASTTPVSSICSSSSATGPKTQISQLSSPITIIQTKPHKYNNVNKQHQQQSLSPARREILRGLALLPLTSTICLRRPSPSEAREIEVGSFLPPAPSDPSFVFFKASTKDTPALRAGNVEPYQFILPPTWKQTRIANILSGNYCQPKCAEPWVEVKFEDEKQGKIQVVASPLIRLTNKPRATIEDIGTPDKVIASLGPFVTGNSFDPDELLESSVQKIGDQTYYKYTLETPYALTGSHNLAKATAKGKTLILFVVSANDEQWTEANQKTLRTVLDSFLV